MQYQNATTSVAAKDSAVAEHVAFFAVDLQAGLLQAGSPVFVCLVLHLPNAG